MKKILYILLLVATSCATFNKTEGDFIQKNTDDKYMDTYEFNQAKLSKETLKAFEPVALEQFNEFFEQVKIALNPSYAADFREEAINAIRGNIITADHRYDSVVTDPEVKLQNYLTGFSDEEVYSKVLKKNKIRQPFGQYSENMYHGQISYRIEGNNQVKTIDTYLVRVVKTFGEDEEQIWEVRFDPF